ncbi:MAG: hypothetical protein QXF07_01790 [Candidatus Micrarchaeia archaeon]
MREALFRFLMFGLMVVGSSFALSQTMEITVHSDTSLDVSLIAEQSPLFSVSCSQVKSYLQSLSSFSSEESVEIMKSMKCKETGNNITLSFSISAQTNKSKMGINVYKIKKADGEYIRFEMNYVSFDLKVKMPSKIISHSGVLNDSNVVIFKAGTRDAYAESKSSSFSFEIIIYLIAALVIGYIGYKILNKPGFLEGKS